MIQSWYRDVTGVAEQRKARRDRRLRPWGVVMALDDTSDRKFSRDAMRAEMLDAETESRLCYAWRDERDVEALHRLITAYMRLAISMAAKFKRYGAPMNDLIQEASVGLMKAADKFDPDRGVRFSTYAVWWIKASIQDYVMRNWSMVRTGSTSSQKSLFFNMRRVQAQLERQAASSGETLDKHQLRQMIATEVGVPLHDVEMMEGRLSGADFSLNATQSSEDAADVTKVIIDGDHSVVDEVYVSMALFNWLQANLRRFTQVFATINIHRIVDQNEAFAWLKPTHVAYAFGYNALDPEKSVLGVLCQTGGRSADGLIYQVQAEAIPPGSTAGYVISKARYLRDMLAPALPRAFDGLKAKTIKINSDDSGLKISKPAQLKDVESDGKKYNVELTELDVALYETEISVDSTTKTKIFPGIFSVCVSTGYYAFGLLNRKSGGKTLGYYETRDFKSENTTEKTRGAIITEIILGIIAAVAGLILTFVTFGAGSFIAIGLGVALVGSIAAVTTMEVVELIRENDGPPVDLLVANATDAVTWATGSHFDPNVAGLNGDLQIGGTYIEDPDINTLAGGRAAALSPQARFQARFALRMKERSK